MFCSFDGHRVRLVREERQPEAVGDDNHLSKVMEMSCRRSSSTGVVVGSRSRKTPSQCNTPRYVKDGDDKTVEMGKSLKRWTTTERREGRSRTAVMPCFTASVMSCHDR